MTNDKRRPARNAAATNCSSSNDNGTGGRLAELDQVLEVRERLVEVLDSLDRDDTEGARFFAQGLLLDFDREVRS